MALVQLTTWERTASKLVRAETLEGVIASAVAKFGLDASRQYKVVVDKGVDEGLEVEDDDVLQCLSTAPPVSGRLTLCVVPSGVAWTGPHCNAVAPAPAPVAAAVQPAQAEVIPVNAAQNVVVGGVLDAAQAGDVIVMNVINDLPGNSVSVMLPCGASSVLQMAEIEEVLENALSDVKKTPQPLDIIHKKNYAVLKVAQIVRDHLAAKGQFSRPAASRFVKAVMNHRAGKYLAVFEKQCAGVTCSNGQEWFTAKVYNGLNYLKGKRGEKNTRKKPDNQEEPNDVEGRSVRARRIRGDYCCPNYLPSLPSEETVATQEQKRVQLLQLTELKQFDADFQRLVLETFPSQRAEILNTSPMSKLATTFISRWPWMCVGRSFLWHCSALCKPTAHEGVWDCESVFEQNFSSKTADIVSCMKSLWEKESALKRPTKRGAKATEMLQLIAEAEQKDITSRGRIGSSSAVMPLVCAFLKENMDLIVVVVQDTADDNIVKDAIEHANENPIIVLKGNSLTEYTSCEVWLLDAVSIKVADLTQGYLVWFMCFQVYDFCYTKEVQSTLEFFQRFFMGLNYDKGDRRENPRRLVDQVDRKVVELASELHRFCSPWRVR